MCILFILASAMLLDQGYKTVVLKVEYIDLPITPTGSMGTRGGGEVHVNKMKQIGGP